MQMLRPVLLGLNLTLFSLQAFAWEVKLQTVDEVHSTPQVIVSSHREMAGVDVYLTWIDFDAKPQFFSWQADRGWEAGLKSVFSTSFDIPKFDSYTIPFQEKACPDDHRCFLGFVATRHGDDPLVDKKNWLAASFLPLSLPAGCERFVGQKFFWSCDDNGSNRFDEGGVMDDADVPTMAAGEKESAPADTSGAGAPAETEKPDIFKLVDHQLLYANGQAKRFQVIDIADLSNPKITGWTALAGSPRELYVLGDYYVLLQTNYGTENGTHLTVLRQNDDGSLKTLQDMPLSGRFIESRRRGSLIYTVTEQFESITRDCGENADCVESQHKINISVLRLTDAGELKETDTAQLSGYSPIIAIFPDYLVIANHNPNQENRSWQNTQIQAFDLSQQDPLVALPVLNVPGQVPSEFHLSVKSNADSKHLRVVYGPEDRQHGSTLAIYNLPDMALIGDISAIAPGEDLFATRFVDNRAFVVTFERKDPLWVIDLSNPKSPSILGELHVPGWSEKMFFHEDRLFAVGIDDQPLDNEESRWVRRVALSLFDVKDPTKPTLINRFTPFAGEVSNSWSPALDDERALLLNWEDSFAALPIDSYETDTGSHLQIVSLANDKIEDAGLLKSPVPIQRSVSIEKDVLAALGDQALLTLSWGAGDPVVLGELELATNLTWLALQGDDLWAAARGNKGYFRLYRYTKEDIETPAESWSLQKGYNGGLLMDDNLAVFYDYYPLTVQVLDVNTGEFFPPQALEKVKEPPRVTGVLEEDEIDEPINEVAVGVSTDAEVSVDVEPIDVVDPIAVAEPMIAPDIGYYDRSQPLFYEGWFHLAEQKPFKPTQEQAALLPVQEQKYIHPQWVLRSWDMKVKNAKEAPSRSIPGRPLTFMANGDLLTQEVTKEGKLRLNLLALEVDSALLLQSRELPCHGYSTVKWTDKMVYVNCEENRHRPGPIYTHVSEEGQTADFNASVSVKEEVEVETKEEPSTQLLKLNPEQGFAEEGNWRLSGYQILKAVSTDVVLIDTNNWYGPWIGGDVIAKPAMIEPAFMPPPDQQNGCNVYQLIAGKEPALLKNLETCPYSVLVLTPTQGWVAEGFAGIKEIKW
jgi:hypothetical protein